MKLHFDRKKGTIILDGEGAIMIVRKDDYGKTYLTPDFIQVTKEMNISFTMQNFDIVQDNTKVINIIKTISDK